MSHPQRIAPEHARTLDPRLVESIAREMTVPVELASRICGEELETLARDARIEQFLQVIACRRARLRLRRHRGEGARPAH